MASSRKKDIGFAVATSIDPRTPPDMQYEHEFDQCGVRARIRGRCRIDADADVAGLDIQARTDVMRAWGGIASGFSWPDSSSNSF
jgi:hypothetical protein